MTGEGAQNGELGLQYAVLSTRRIELLLSRAGEGTSRCFLSPLVDGEGLGWEVNLASIDRTGSRGMAISLMIFHNALANIARDCVE